MKNRLILSLAIIMVSLPYLFSNANSISTHASSMQYARITSSNARLYKTATENNNISNVICYLEETYFVEVLLNFNIDFYKVSYNGEIGYALKSNLELVEGTPKTPFPISTITTTNSRCYLRSSPEVQPSNLNTLCVIPSNCNKIKYIGKAFGTEAVDYKGTTWYYVEYLETKGYIYNNYIANISSIYQNLENLQPLSTVKEIINPLSTPKCAIIIAIISAPCLFILILLYKKPAIKTPKLIPTLNKPNKPINKRKLESEEEKL